MNEIVKYKNDFNGIVFDTLEINRAGKKELLTWTGQELKTFFALIGLVRDKGSEKIKISLQYLKELCGYEHKGYAQFAEHLRQMDEKKLSLIGHIRLDSSGNYERFTIFTDFAIDMKKRELTIGVHEKAIPLLNDVRNNFTRFNLEELVGIKGKYAILLYRELKQYRLQGVWNVDYKTFKELMGIRSSDNKKIRDKILIPAIEGLKPIYPDLTVERKYIWNGSSRETNRLIFRFTPENPMQFRDKGAEDRFADYNLANDNIDEERWAQLGDVYQPRNNNHNASEA